MVVAFLAALAVLIAAIAFTLASSCLFDPRDDIYITLFLFCLGGLLYYFI